MWLVITEGPDEGHFVELDRSARIGRDDDCELVLSDTRASRLHARFDVRPDGVIEVSDVGSTNGVFVGGTRIAGSTVIRPGDAVRIGRTTIALRIGNPAAGPLTAFESGMTEIERPAPVAPVAAAPPPSTPGVPPEAPPVPSGGRLPTGRLLAGAAAVVAVAALIGALVWITDDESSGQAGPATSTTPSTTAAAPTTTTAAPTTTTASSTTPPTTAVEWMAPEDVVEQAKPGTMLITSARKGRTMGSGSGWVLDAEEGFVVTNMHVVNSGDQFYVGAEAQKRSATLVAASPCEDLALLRVDNTSGLQRLPMGDQSELRDGQEVLALGYPANVTRAEQATTTRGVISNSHMTFDVDALDIPKFRNVIQTDTAINPGNSGGPLLNLLGEVVGVNSAASVSRENQGYAIGIDRVKQLLPALTAGTSTNWVGMTLVFPSSVEEVLALGYPAEFFGSAIFATGAVDLSPAADVGIRQLVEDWGGQPIAVIGVDGKAMNGTLHRYCQAMGNRTSGADVTVNFMSPTGDRADVATHIG
jgi:S1-C subfamily serine protease